MIYSLEVRNEIEIETNKNSRSKNSVDENLS